MIQVVDSNGQQLRHVPTEENNKGTSLLQPCMFHTSRITSIIPHMCAEYASISFIELFLSMYMCLSAVKSDSAQAPALAGPLCPQEGPPSRQPAAATPPHIRTQIDQRIAAPSLARSFAHCLLTHRPSTPPPLPPDSICFALPVVCAPIIQSDPIRSHRHSAHRSAVRSFPLLPLLLCSHVHRPLRPDCPCRCRRPERRHSARQARRRHHPSRLGRCGHPQAYQ